MNIQPADRLRLLGRNLQLYNDRLIQNVAVCNGLRKAYCEPLPLRHLATGDSYKDPHVWPQGAYQRHVQGCARQSAMFIGNSSCRSTPQEWCQKAVHFGQR